MNEATIPMVTGNLMRTASGKYINFADPEPNQFDLMDIAIGLGSECRFGNQLRQHYSVAEHCVHCLRIARRTPGVSRSILKAVLMHDAAEAFCGDVPKPLKIMMPEYKVIEDRIQSVIDKKYSIIKHRQFVKHVDLVALKFEKSFFGGQDKQHDLSSIPNVKFGIRCWDRSRAAEVFFQTALTLGMDLDV